MTAPQDIIKETERILIKTYNMQPVIMDHGKGVYAYDTNGKKYLDCAAGIAVASLGHAHKKLLSAINKQAERMIICQPSYVTQAKHEAAKLLVDNSCFDMVYFSNSGTESVEAALKCARKWAYDEKGNGCNEIITFHNSFHGRTYGSASVTEKRNSQPFFDPYIPNVHFAKFNNIDSVKALVSDKTAAIIIEPIQGEGGLSPANSDFLKSLRKLCDEQNICLIFDEVQAGFGRLGTLHAYQYFGVEPDIATWAKGMGAGFPVGAMAAKEKFGKAIVVGTHGTTYGGNPLACAVVKCVMEEILSDGFIDNVNKISKIMFDGLSKIQRDSNKITDIRGAGLMIGVDSVFDIKEVLKNLQKNGLMATQAGKATLRLTPPLIISKAQAQEAIAIIDKTFKEME